MIKKYIGITLITASMLVMGCSSSDDDDPVDTTTGTTDPGTTDPGTTDPGTTDPGTTDPGTTDPGTTDPGTTDPGTTDPGTTDPLDFGTSVMNVIDTKANLTTLAAAIKADVDGGLAQTLADTNNTWTMFAPTDDAMTALGGGTLDRAGLLRHISDTSLSLEDLTGLVGSTLSMTAGDPLAITALGDGTIQIGGVSIIESDLAGSNGTVHIIDGVLP